MNYIQVTIESISEEKREILIALLAEEGFEGFEESGETLKAYVEEEQFNEEVFSSVAGLKNGEYSTALIPKQNWNAVWESNFQPVLVDDFVSVRADFHEPVLNIAHEIIITPKMSFGTGHHATTFMMVQQMRQLDFAGKKVFDFGTGTGILAILAEKLGAAQITAIDNDDWSITNAAENLSRNNCSRILLELSETVPANKSFEIILANINKNVILHHFDEIVDALSPGGSLLLSGLLTEDETHIVHIAKKYDIIHQSTESKDKWICMHFNG